MPKEKKDGFAPKNFSAKDIGKIRLKTLDEGVLFSEFNKSRDQLMDMMRQYMTDCGKIIAQMNDLIENMKELEKSKTEEIYAMMQRDIQKDEIRRRDGLNEIDDIDDD